MSATVVRSKPRKYPHAGVRGMGRPPKVTPAVRSAFLDKLMDNGARVGDACRAVGVSPKSMFQHKRADPKFESEWERVMNEALHVYDDEAKRRALEDLNDGLLTLILSRRHPAYRQDQSTSNTTTIVFLGPALDSKPACDPALEVQQPSPALEAPGA